MLKISDAINEIITNQPFLMFGLQNRLFNLSNLARFIKPLVESRTKKKTKESAILMNLSRLQKKISKNKPDTKNFKINNLTVHSDLCSVTFTQDEEVYNQLNKFQNEIRKKDGYITLSHGTSEVTIIISQSFLPILKKIIPQNPKYIKENLSSIGIQFHPKYGDLPGLFYYITQQITLQNININEISSTYTELILYISQKDIKLAFNTLNELFSANYL